jgi:hypothetical protein
MPSPLRTAAGLLLVYPALILTFNVAAAVQYRSAAYLLNGAVITVLLSVTGLYLWRRRGWAYATALVCSAGLAALLVLYMAASAYVWGGEMWKGMTLPRDALVVLPVAAPAAAFALLVRDDTFPGVRRRVLLLAAAALAIELLLMALIAVFGVGGFSGDWYQDVLRLSQMPGETILDGMGMCCGYENETIISDVIDPHWGGITRHGMPTLVAANTLGVMPVLALIRGLLVRFHARRTTPALVH